MTTDSMVVDVSKDWAIARDVQQRFMELPIRELPKMRPRALTYSARCRQVWAIGGDCFDFLPLPGRRTAFAVADASGKGLPAALIAANVQSSLRTAALFAPENAAAVITAVNRQLHGSTPAERYATLFYGVFEEDTRALQYVNAGHNPAFVVRGGELVAWLDADAPPVGLFADTAYEARSVQLNVGDVIVAYTDGMVEARNAGGEDWGVSGLVSAVTACPARKPAKIVQSALDALAEFSTDGPSDDATILATL